MFLIHFLWMCFVEPKQREIGQHGGWQGTCPHERVPQEVFDGAAQEKEKEEGTHGWYHAQPVRSLLPAMHHYVAGHRLQLHFVPLLC